MIPTSQNEKRLIYLLRFFADQHCLRPFYFKGEEMTELEKLLDKIYWHADAQGIAQAQILSTFADKDKKIYELESENLSLRHDKAIIDNYVKELEAQVEKMKKAIDIRDRIME